MPKCDSCQYLMADGYEYPEYYCKIFGYDVPKQYQTKNDDGCRCTRKFLKKRSDAQDKAEAEYWERMAESYAEWGRKIILESE